VREGREEREREGRIEEIKRTGTEDRIVGPHQHFKQIDAYGVGHTSFESDAPENIGIAVEISQITCSYQKLFLFPVYKRHFVFLR